MLAIKKTGEGYYLATLTDHYEELVRNDCHAIKKEIRDIIKPHREVTLDIKGIKAIDKGGFIILTELKKLADSNNCKLRFINVDPSLATKIAGLRELKLL